MADVAGESARDAMATAFAPPSARDEQTYYESGGGRKTFYALAFIVLLPFFISMPVMLVQRAIAGVWLDTWGLAILGIGFTIIMVLLLFELVFSLRAKVDIGSKAVALTLPSQGGGLTPTIFYQSRTIAYDDIAGVQSYCDCYGGSMAPMIMRGFRIVLKSGERVPLGFVNEADDDPRFPFKTIAQQIAERAGVKIDDLGHARYALHRKMFGIKADAGDGMPPEEVASINRQHNMFLTGIILVMVVLLLLGIGSDFLQATAEWGERAVTQPIGQ